MLTTQKIYIKNNSKKVSDEIFKTIVKANVILTKECADLWNIEQPEVSAATKDTKFKDDDWVFYIVDDDPENVGPGALAYHTQGYDGKIYSYTLVSTILKSGGCIINPYDIFKKDDKPDRIYNNEEQKKFKQISSVASALSHEILETLVDPTCNIFWNSYKGGKSTMYCAEICDMVQDKNIVLHVDGLDVHLSNFVLPSWKDQMNKKGPFDYRGILKNNFTLDAGGYAETYGILGSKTIFANKVPLWHLNGHRRIRIRKEYTKNSCSIQ
jgi:hypothetical protein